MRYKIRYQQAWALAWWCHYWSLVTIVFCANGSKQLNIGSFNIHELGCKLENEVVQQWIRGHDIVFLCETKTDLQITFPGYEVINGRTCTPIRGGVILLVKQYLYNWITDIDITANDQIWFRLAPLPGVLFGGFYIAPHDSIYYEEASLSYILCKYMDDVTDTHIWFGNFNARLGKIVSTLVADNEHFS